MSSRKAILILMFTGSLLGGLVPELFGISTFSFTSLLTSALGAVAGIYLGYRLTR